MMSLMSIFIQPSSWRINLPFSMTMENIWIPFQSRDIKPSSCPSAGCMFQKQSFPLFNNRRCYFCRTRLDMGNNRDWWWQDRWRKGSGQPATISFQRRLPLVQRWTYRSTGNIVYICSSSIFFTCVIHRALFLLE